MAHDLSAHIPFNMGGLERCERERADEDWLKAQQNSADARFIVLDDLKVAMHTAGGLAPGFVPGTQIEGAFTDQATILFLGLRGETPIFAIDIDASISSALQQDGLSFIDVRTIAMQFDGPDLAIIGHARSMMSWHLKNKFCGTCGSPTVVKRGGAVRRCTNEACAIEYYPRNDPVVIMLAHHGDQCLLGRQHRFPPRMYSALAGFLEHGESLEEAVRRELHEEAGITSGKVDYVASQAWPFEQSIMIACLAEATQIELNIDKEELDDARWVSLDDMRSALAGDPQAPIAVPPNMAIAHHLVQHWVDSRSN